MSGLSIGNLLASTASPHRQTNQPVWRSSFDIDDERAKVGRPFGDGSPKQARSIITAIRDTMSAWIKKERTVTDEEGRVYRLSWDLARTWEAAMSFMTFWTGECTPSYDMIAEAAGCCRLTAIRHMALLRLTGWLDWARRTQMIDGGKVVGAPNGYFFEISRIPFIAQIHLRQMLKRRGVTLESHPERKGSGPVPNRAQRLAERVAKGFAGMMDRLSGRQRRDEQMREADFIRAETELLGDIPTGKWAEIRHPEDPDAQAAYNARLGIFFDLPSNRNAPDSGVQNKDKRN